MWPLTVIRETERRLKDRFNEHRRAVDETSIKSKPTTASEHFLSYSNHSPTDMQLIPLEKIHSSRDSVRKARESHLIDKATILNLMPKKAKSEKRREERKRKVKVKTAVSLLNLEILLSGHAWTSQADILHLDQKAVKYTTCKRLCGKF